MPVLPPTTYKVRIVCRTFNQAQYIKDAMNGFCMQKTNFPFVAIIIDDASTDGEPKIISQYLEDHFDMGNAQYDENDDAKRIAAVHKGNPNCHFLVILLKYNFYSIKKAQYPLYKGWYENVPYIAWCEGDDYWTDPLKLQKQVNYLETHPECGLVHTKHKQYVEETGKFKDGWAEETDFEKNLIRNRICTMTTCYRSLCLVDYNKEIVRNPNWPMGDAPLWLYIMSKSSSKLLPDETGVYRVRKESASHSDNIEKNIRFLLGGFDMKLYFIKKYHKEEYQRINAVYVVKELKRLSYLYNKSIDFNFLSFFYKNRIWDVKLFLSTLPVKYDGLRKVMFKVKR